VCGMILRRRFYAVFVEAEDLGFCRRGAASQSSEDARRLAGGAGPWSKESQIPQRGVVGCGTHVATRVYRRVSPAVDFTSCSAVSPPSARKESRGMMPA
jgi:hypothetical protein